jgi:hypothetical protein
MRRRHHPTGALDGVHLDPELVFDVSHEEHDAEHKVRGLLGLDRGASASTSVGRVELRLRRLAVFLVETFAPRLPEGAPKALVLLLATHVESWADDLLEAGEAEPSHE